MQNNNEDFNWLDPTPPKTTAEKPQDLNKVVQLCTEEFFQGEMTQERLDEQLARAIHQAEEDELKKIKEQLMQDTELAQKLQQQEKHHKHNKHHKPSHSADVNDDDTMDSDARLAKRLQREFDDEESSNKHAKLDDDFKLAQALAMDTDEALARQLQDQENKWKPKYQLPLPPPKAKYYDSEESGDDNGYSEDDDLEDEEDDGSGKALSHSTAGLDELDPNTISSVGIQTLQVSSLSTHQNQVLVLKWGCFRGNWRLLGT